jgi:hypothetical protein
VKLLERVLNIRPAEFSRVLLLSFGWASVIGFTIAGKAARDAIFLSRHDQSYLPLMVVAVAVVSVVAVAVTTRLSKYLKARQILALAGVVVKPWLTGTLKSSAEGLSGLAIFFAVKAVSLSVLSVLALRAIALDFEM